MVKIMKSFEFLLPQPEKVESGASFTWTGHDLLIRGKAALLCTGPHPIYPGYYRLALKDKRPQVLVYLRQAIDMVTNEDILPRVDVAGLEDVARAHATAKFLSL